MRPIDADELYDRLMTRYAAHNLGDTRDMAARAAIMSCMEAVERSKTITIYTSSNGPLTLEELREMDGEPVWVIFTPDSDGERLTIWALVSVDEENDEVFLQNSIGGRSSYEEVREKVEEIYRRRLEEGKA